MSKPSRLPAAGPPSADDGRNREPSKVSDELQRWLTSEGEKTLGSLIELFEQKSFAILFVVLLGVPRLLGKFGSLNL